MKSIEQINDLLEKFEKQFGFAVKGHVQQSEIWFQLKLGVLSASNAHKIVAKRDSDTRNTYMCELISQVCTGSIEEISAAALDWGRQHEDSARSYYEFSNSVTMTQLPFVFKDDTFRIGGSPDGVVSEIRGSEIKCPWNSANYVKFLVSDDIKPEWKWQNQFNMWVMDADEWDFTQFDPRMKKSPMKTLVAVKDLEKQKVLEDLVPMFISDMDQMLAKIGIEFGSQWTRLAELPPAASGIVKG